MYNISLSSSNSTAEEPVRSCTVSIDPQKDVRRRECGGGVTTPRTPARVKRALTSNDVVVDVRRIENIHIHIVNTIAIPIDASVDMLFRSGAHPYDCY